MASSATSNVGPGPPPSHAKDDKIDLAVGNADFVVRVTSYKDRNGQRSVVRFMCSKKLLTTGSEYFAASLRFQNTHRNENGDPAEITLKDDDIGAMTVWLSRLHNIDEDKLWGHGGAYETTDIDRMWHVVNSADKYQFNLALLVGFFIGWYKKNVMMIHMNVDFASALVLPCAVFDYAVGFAEVTKWLAYNAVGHISEKRPHGFKMQHLHLHPPEFVGPMNHARGSLKTCLHRGIWNKVGPILEHGAEECECGDWAQSAGHYFAALVETRAYPLETSWAKNSVNKILKLLKDFKITYEADSACFKCSVDWDDAVENAVLTTLRYFDGLCLDCMDNSKPKRDNTDTDYWKHLESVDGRWDSGCRIQHGQPTWYVSWCGKNEHRQTLLQLHRKRDD